MTTRTRTDVLLLAGFCAFLFFYGLGQFGLVGADEPRYAQVAREMLERHDWITPVLGGQSWLEKPPLYYWQAMVAYSLYGVSDTAARVPSAFDATLLVIAVYVFLRRFRPGVELDGALITASCAGVIGYARAAGTDMALASTFSIAMLAWWGWRESGKRAYLAAFYFFLALGTLAKGPVAPFLAIVILFAFAALRREWSILRRTFWWPGAALYLAMVLPWFIAVQKRNPNFLRIFFLQHNLERFATNRFQHEQSFWYYIPIVILSLTPWAVLAIAAFSDAVRQSIAEWKARRAKYHYMGNFRAGDAFPEFLVLWALIPIIFFSLSRSKLPGYILPSIPPLTILTGDYLNRTRERGLKLWLLITHALLTGLLTAFVIILPLHLQHPGSMPPLAAILAGGMTGFAAAVFILITVYRFGLKRLRIATMTPMVIMIIFLFGIGPFFGLHAMANTKRNITLVDLTYSARPLANILSEISPPNGIVAVYKVRRDLEYGLSFYRDHRVLDYEKDGIPPEQHLLVTRESYIEELRPLLQGRRYEPLFTYPAQNLVVYAVSMRK